MIWLRKHQNDMLSNCMPDTLINYFENGTEIFEEYFSRACYSLNDSNTKDDIFFHLDQLIDIAIHCKLLSDWFSKLTQKERIKYFSKLSDINFIRNKADYHFHFSKNRLDEVDKKVINILDNSFNEFCEEFCKKLAPYTDDVVKLRFFKPKYPTTCFWISHILQCNLLIHIRLSPQPYVLYKHENCNFILDIPDFVNYQLFRVDENYQPKEAIENTTLELLNLSNECFDDFIKLASLYVYKKQKSNSEHFTINIQQNINNPEFNYKAFSSIFHNETFNFEADEKSSVEIKETSVDDIKCLMFKNLQKNSGYKVFKAHLEQTDVYFKALFDLGYINYLDKVVNFVAPFSNGAFAELMKDPDFLFSEIKMSIPDSAYIDLTGRKFNQLEKRSDDVKKYADVKNALINKGVPVKQH